jgi:hypothetical protein
MKGQKLHIIFDFCRPQSNLAPVTVGNAATQRMTNYGRGA